VRADDDGNVHVSSAKPIRGFWIKKRGLSLHHSAKEQIEKQKTEGEIKKSLYHAGGRPQEPLNRNHAKGVQRKGAKAQRF
jgi:hypothetical protein